MRKIVVMYGKMPGFIRIVLVDQDIFRGYDVKIETLTVLSAGIQTCRAIEAAKLMQVKYNAKTIEILQE